MEQSSNISKYVKYSNRIKLMEQDPFFKDLENSLVKTLDFLSKKFSVRNHYDYFSEPYNDRNCEMLFKVSFLFEDIMWVYFKYAERVRYLSVEFDPVRISSIRDQLSGFDDTVIRNKKPQLKLIYTDFDRIEKSLSDICNCFDGSTADVPNDINTPLRPKGRIRKSDGTITYICGRCEIKILKSPRCPECGQLVKE